MQQYPAIELLEKSSTVYWFPCGAGQMPVRHWQRDGAESVILLHGGSGSWLHWVKNIEALAGEFDLYAVDLPGLGDAAMCEVDSSATSAAETTAEVLRALMKSSFHIVAFSWGCTITAMMMERLADQLKSVMLTGPAAVGDLPLEPSMKPLIKRTPEMSREAVLAAQRENLARLMIYNPELIDPLAIHIQEINTSKARFSSPQYARSKLLIDAIRGTHTPLYVVYGDHDAPAYPEIKERRILFKEARPDVRFELVETAGHWLQFEKSALFNTRCIEWLHANS